MKLRSTTLAALALLAPLVHAAGMSASSTSFADGAAMASVHANSANGCGGQDVTPQVAWHDLPAGTASIAVLLVDPDGGKGLGVTHWVAYGIAPDHGHGQIRQGEGGGSADGIVVGRNSAGDAAYRGICPPVGDVAHHYVLTVIATDVAPASLAPGMTREELLAALKGHGLVSQSVVGRYAR